MKKIFSFIFALSIVLISPFNSYASCEAGTPGATSCTLSKKIGAGLATGSIDVDITISITCGDGYYACCNIPVFGDASAKCIPNPKPKQAFISPAN